MVKWLEASHLILSRLCHTATMTNAVIQNLPVYSMSVIKVPMVVYDQMDMLA